MIRPRASPNAPSGLVTLMLSSSLLATVQPPGNVNDSPLFDTVPPGVVGVGVATGLGEPAGLGLGSMPTEPLLFARLPRTAKAVPHPAISTTSTTIALMMRTQGVRCTGGCGPTALGE